MMSEESRIRNLLWQMDQKDLELATLHKRVEELEGELPCTADGARKLHGDSVFNAEGELCIVVADVQYDLLNHCWARHWAAVPVMDAGELSRTRTEDVDCCFSSREAAAAGGDDG